MYKSSVYTERLFIFTLKLKDVWRSKYNIIRNELYELVQTIIVNLQRSFFFCSLVLDTKTYNSNFENYIIVQTPNLQFFWGKVWIHVGTWYPKLFIAIQVADESNGKKKLILLLPCVPSSIQYHFLALPHLHCKFKTHQEFSKW